MHYCTECGWSTEGSEHAGEHERNLRAIEHHVETGHTVVSRSPPVRSQGSTEGTLDRRPME